MCSYEVGLLDSGEHERIDGRKPVAMYNADGEFLSVYKSIATMCHDNNFNENTVRATINGRKKSYKKHTFKYVTKEEYIRLTENIIH